jgi:hypothetical protein
MRSLMFIDLILGRLQWNFQDISLADSMNLQHETLVA